MSVSLPDDAPKPRLCHVRKWDDFNGYGFNLHAEKGKAGQYIGKVDPGSPADFAGLKEGDRIVEVNGTNISNENHQQVVQRVKAIPNETKLLVVDGEAEEYYKAQKIVVRGDMPNVLSIEAPVGNPNTQTNAVENNVSDSGSEKGEEDRKSARSSRSSSPARDSTPVEAVAATAVAVEHQTVHPFKARLCYLKIWSNFAGYGFNLHAEKNKSGQYIGKVDPGSPAEAAGLLENDRIIEVNGENVTGESHQHVVSLVKSVPNETRLLVLSPQADEYFKDRDIKVTSTSDFVDRIECPDTKPVTENSSPVTVEAPSVDSPYKARLIQLQTWPNYSGYGFNMHSIKGKEGEYIGKVEQGSPAFVAGLKEGDRVIEVGGINTEKNSHGEVVEKIKAASGRAKLLVVDAEADAYFREKRMQLSGTMAAVTVLNCPDTKPEANGTSEAITSQENNEETALSNGHTDYEIVSAEPVSAEPISAEPTSAEPVPAEPEEAPVVSAPATDTRDEVDRAPTPPPVVEEDNTQPDINDYEQVNVTEDVSPLSPDPSNNNEDDKDVIIDHTPSEPKPAYEEPPPSYESEAQAAPAVVEPTPAPAPAPAKKEAVVIGGIEFAGSVEEARKRMSGKKREVRSSSAMSAKEKYELFQKL